jgi:hypothetical protein
MIEFLIGVLLLFQCGPMPMSWEDCSPRQSAKVPHATQMVTPTSLEAP